jgi:Domain of unknown function (DUF4386)
MMRKTIGTLSVVTCALTLLWLVFLLAGMANAAPATTLDQILANVAHPGILYYATYINAALITIAATMLYAVLYGFFKHEDPAWAVIAVLFVPVYCSLNLAVYLSQITLVPNLLGAYQVTEYQPAARVLLSQAIQQAPDSTMSFVNNLAYAVLGIPSIIFGTLLLGHGAQARLAGALLALNGVACMFGMVGVLFKIPLLASGSLVGGVLFLLAMVPLALTFLEQNKVSLRDLQFGEPASRMGSHRA